MIIPPRIIQGQRSTPADIAPRPRKLTAFDVHRAMSPTEALEMLADLANRTNASQADSLRLQVISKLEDAGVLP